MAIIKCKMCGGDLKILPEMTVAECEYCGTKQTIPNADNEKKMTLFSRANRLRFGCEFDKAAGIYETIVADFPEEAEAYWGLILCKYGIEYVDDPATGKKIPTCHRSSFESVLDDHNFELVMEYSDAVARRIYREEAKQIEELRKGIIEVSGREEPYDIFICYKETDENGNRTLDSVMAQDVYDELTRRGYRVFFSRISLEDKLGQEYEPYIFAALNSAKVMLAFGTDYEYYHTVWVKNEWSRYLQLMTHDKSKHLIPCYRGIDAYDMPREFSRLQAQDMGKVGAMQDLLRGIEKLLHREDKSQPMVQQVVTSGGPNTAALVKRGYIALEDGNPEKADEFFDRALDIHAECAEAYLGKALVEFKAVSLKQLENQLKYSPQMGQQEQVQAMKPDKMAEDALVQKYVVPECLDERNLRWKLRFDFAYNSQTKAIEAEFNRVNTILAGNKNLARAETYGGETVKEQIIACKAAISNSFQSAIRESRKADEAKVQKIRQDYVNHLANKEKEFALLHSEAQEKAKKAPLRRKESAARAKKVKGIVAAAAIVAVIAIVISLVLPGLTTPEQESMAAPETTKPAVQEAAEPVIETEAPTEPLTPEEQQYRNAEQLLASGKIAQAAIEFGKLGDYADAKARSLDLWDKIAPRQTLDAGRYSTLAVKNDGTVLATGYDYNGELDVEDWTDVKSVHIVLYEWTLGLRSDGTVLTAGRRMKGKLDGWKDVVSLPVVWGSIIGIQADGTLVSASTNAIVQEAVENWADIIDVKYDSYDELIVGLRADGTVLALGNNENGQCNVENWTEVVQIANGGNHVVGLRADGTVLTTAKGKFAQYELLNLTDVIQIEAGNQYIRGLRENGTVTVAGKDRLRSDLWTDIIEIDMNQGLEKDGTITSGLWTGDDYNITAAKKWTDIVFLAQGDFHLAGLCYDGTVVAAGNNYKDQCKVTKWKDVRMPNSIRHINKVLMQQWEEQAPLEEASIPNQETAVATQADPVLAAQYAEAEKLLASGDKARAAIAFGKLGNYSDAKERSVDLWKTTEQMDAIATGFVHTVGLKADGTVVAVGDNIYNQCEVGEWKDIIAISDGHEFTLGLKSDGTVVAAGLNVSNRYSLDSWKDIVAISGGKTHTVGLKSNGTVVAAGYNDNEECEVSSWKDIVAISAGGDHTVGLKSDGTVVAVGDNGSKQCQVDNWENIVAISAGWEYTVGLKADGTVVAVGDNDCNQCDVGNWTDIVAIYASNFHTVGIKSDGTVVAVGYEENGQCDVAAWTEIVAVAAGNVHTVGVKADGTVVTVGSNGKGQCNASDWIGIKLPNI